MTLESVVLECRDKEQLIGFYSRLLDWPVVYRDAEFVCIQAPDGGAGIAAQEAEDYRAPVWPTEEGRQQMMAHLDFAVRRAEYPEILEKALRLGARMAPAQFGEGEWTTLLDPAGHPFCLVLAPEDPGEGACG